MRSSFFTSAVLCGALAFGSAAQASALGADFTDGSRFNSGVFNNIGWSFAVTASTTIDGLGVFDFDSNGLTNVHQVGLWDSSGTLLAQTTVSNASTVEASDSALGRWLFKDIAAITLGTGNYVIGAFYSDRDADNVLTNAINLTTAASLTYTSSLATDAASFAQPGFYGFVQPGIFGPNLRIASVPEPMSLALVALAIAGAAAARRRSH